MENASKALTMAAGVLIAVMTLTLLVYGYINMNKTQSVVQKNKETEQLAAFNKAYESYNKKLMRGTDVISVMNKAIDNNTKYNYNIKIVFILKTDLIGKNWKLNANEEYNMYYYDVIIRTRTDIFTELKTRVFDCTEINYSSDTGRVNYMKFVERKIT